MQTLTLVFLSDYVRVRENGIGGQTIGICCFCLNEVLKKNKKKRNKIGRK